MINDRLGTYNGVDLVLTGAYGVSLAMKLHAITGKTITHDFVGAELAAA